LLMYGFLFSVDPILIFLVLMYSALIDLVLIDFS